MKMFTENSRKDFFRRKRTKKKGTKAKRIVRKRENSGRKKRERREFLGMATNLTGRRSRIMTGKTILTYAQGLKPKKHMTPSWTNWQNVKR